MWKKGPEQKTHSDRRIKEQKVGFNNRLISKIQNPTKGRHTKAGNKKTTKRIQEN